MVQKRRHYPKTASRGVNNFQFSPFTRHADTSLQLAWQIGRSIALSRSQKLDPIVNLLKEQNGVLLFIGKIVSVERRVGSGFTRGSVTLESFSDTNQTIPKTILHVDFENENLNAILKEEGKLDKLLAICPDLITFLDRANGAPLGVSDYKYGLRVSVIALKSSPVWTSPEGLQMGGPRAFGYVGLHFPAPSVEILAWI